MYLHGWNTCSVRPSILVYSHSGDAELYPARYGAMLHGMVKDRIPCPAQHPLLVLDKTLLILLGLRSKAQTIVLVQSENESSVGF